MEGYKFCPYCRDNLTETAIYYRCNNCQKYIFKHPCLASGIIPYKNGEILLCRRAIEPQKNKIDMIGGFIQYGESVEQGALREAKEETGGKCRLIRLLGNYYDRYEYQGINYRSLVFVFLAEVSGKLIPNDDISGLEWYDLGNLPDDDQMAFEYVRKSLTDLKKQLE